MPTQRKYAFFALVTLCLCVLALYIHRHRQGQTGKIDNFLISSAGGMQKTVFYFTQGTRRILDHYLFLVSAQEQNDQYRKDLDLLRTKITQLQEVELENARLRESLAFRARTDLPLLAAHVVAHDVSADYFGVRVDKGALQGVRVGMGVISPSGLVGRVLRVSPNYADVLTLVDPTSNIDGVIQRSRARGIISGQSKQLTCRMKYLDRLEDVAVNDVVVASGFGNIFPKGLLIGYVTSVVPSPNGILQNVTVKSAVDIYRLEEVFIVFPPAESEKTT